MHGKLSETEDIISNDSCLKYKVGAVYKTIWFLQDLDSDLCGRTIEFRIMTSDGITTLEPSELKLFIREECQYIIYQLY